MYKKIDSGLVIKIISVYCFIEMFVNLVIKYNVLFGVIGRKIVRVNSFLKWFWLFN